MLKSNRIDKKFERMCVLLVALLLIVGIFASGILDRQKVWKEMTYYDVLTFSKEQPELFTSSNLFERATYSLEAGDSYGILNEGPGFNLPKGRYRLKYRVDADGENAIYIRSKNGAQIEPDVIRTRPDEWEDEAWIEIREDADHVQIQFAFESGTTMRVDDLRMYSPEYKDNAYTAALLILTVCLIAISRGRGKLSDEGLGAMVVIGLAVLICCAPAMQDGLIMGHDTEFHLARIMNLADGLANDQFPVRLGGFTHNGFGAITSVFYPDLLLYPFAMLINGGASITYVMNLIYATVNIVSAMTMYVCAKRIFSSRETGVCASVLYILASYRVANLYSRCAMGEMWAMAVLPLFILGMWEVVFGDRNRWPVLAVGAVLIYLSHLLTTVLCAVGAIGACVVCARQVLKEGRFFCLMKAAAAALLMGLYTLVPFLMYSSQGIGAQGNLGANTLNMLPFGQLFLWGEGKLAANSWDWRTYRQTLEIGFPLLLGTAILLYILVIQPKKDQNEKYALFFVLGGLISAVISTSVFPWAHLEKLTAGYSNYLQFPWRALSMTSGMMALGCGYAYMRLAGDRKEWMQFAVLALSLVMVLPTLTDETHSEEYMEFGQGATPFIRYTEYMLPGSNVYKTTDRQLHAEGDIQLTHYSKDSTTITAHVDAKTDSTVSLPLFGYDGYRAELGGEEIAWTLGENNRLTVEIPAGTSGELRVWFAGKAVWRVAEAVSVATALGLALLGWKRRRKVQ